MLLLLLIYLQFDDLVASLRKDDSITAKTATSANETIGVQFAWISTHQKSIDTYFKSGGKSSASWTLPSTILLLSVTLYALL